MNLLQALNAENDFVMVHRGAAAAIGLNESIALKQVHSLTTSTSTAKKRGNEWSISNTWASWRKYIFPFWSISTIRRAFNNLEKLGLIRVETEYHDNSGAVKTQWFFVNESKMTEIDCSASTPSQNEQGGLSKMNRGSVQNEQTQEITRDNKEITTPPAVTPMSLLANFVSHVTPGVKVKLNQWCETLGEKKVLFEMKMLMTQQKTTLTALEQKLEPSLEGAAEGGSDKPPSEKHTPETPKPPATMRDAFLIGNGISPLATISRKDLDRLDELEKDERVTPDYVLAFIKDTFKLDWYTAPKVSAGYILRKIHQYIEDSKPAPVSRVVEMTVDEWETKEAEREAERKKELQKRLKRARMAVAS